MKDVVPDATTVLLGEFVVYVDASEFQGIATMTKYISDGRTYMAISYSGTHEFICRPPSVGGLNDWDWAELCSENALHHFVDTH